MLELLGGLVVPKTVSMLMGKHSKALLTLMGILSIIFAFLLFAFPGDGIIALIWVVGIYAIIIGAISIVGAAMAARWT
jgi:uncharacterized membrane protein HdeD (DUF308 family)